MVNEPLPGPISSWQLNPAARSDPGLAGEIVYLTSVRVECPDLVSAP